MALISKYFSELETVRSQLAERVGLANIPHPEEKLRISKTAQKMGIVRELLGHPVIVSSWYRCPELNRLVGSKVTSAHIRGEAVDFTCPQYGTPYEVAKLLELNAAVLEFDQLIYEHTWVHIAFNFDSTRVARQELLTLEPNGKYSRGINLN